jgi:SAM-dependent methyltransferase
MWMSYLLPYLVDLDRQKTVIVDVGCGYGDGLYALKKIGFQKLYGVDICAESVEIARHNGFDVTQSDMIAYLRSTTVTPDVVILFDIIEHLTHAECLDLFEAIHNRLSPSGRVILHTVNAANPFFGNTLYGDITHKIAYTEGSLRQLVAHSRFVVRDIRGTNCLSRWHPNWLLRCGYCFIAVFTQVSECCMQVAALSQGIVIRNIKANVIAILEPRK